MKAGNKHSADDSQDRQFSEILGTTDISKICGVTTQTVQSWIDRGVLKAFRTPGGHRRVKREDFIEFLEKFQFPAASRSQSATQPRVLIADDEEDLRDSLHGIIGRLAPSAQITACSTGAEALIQMGLSRPDVAILDVFMPGLSGIQILDKIKETPEFKQMRVIIITGHKNRVAEGELMDRGAHAVLFKPFTTDELKKHVEDVLKSAIAG